MLQDELANPSLEKDEKKGGRWEVRSMYNRLLLLLPPTCVLLLLLNQFNQIIPSVNLWRTDPYLRRRARVEKACQDFKEQIERDEHSEGNCQLALT